MVMVFRLYGLYGQRGIILFSLGTLAILDFVAEIIASTYVQRQYLDPFTFSFTPTALYARAAISAARLVAELTFLAAIYYRLPAPGVHLCYLHPTSSVFALAFIAPTVFHHIILGFTLFKSYQHLSQERAIGGQSVVSVLRRDQIFYVLVSTLLVSSGPILTIRSFCRRYVSSISSTSYSFCNSLPRATSEHSSSDAAGDMLTLKLQIDQLSSVDGLDSNPPWSRRLLPEEILQHHLPLQISRRLETVFYAPSFVWSTEFQRRFLA